MKIQEVMNTTGMSKKALQYYEDKALIHVDKDDNGYRNYDVLCVNRLWQIKVLRKMDFSIHEIEQILKNNNREGIFKEHFNEVDRRMSQCMIQKDYLQALYDDIEHVCDPMLLQTMDAQMEDDFKRNEAIYRELKTEKPHMIRNLCFTIMFFIGLACFVLGKTDIGVYLIVISALNSLLQERFCHHSISPIRVTYADGKEQIRSFFERRKKDEANKG